MLTPAIRTGYKEAARITRETAKTFYFASLLLPANKRYAAYSIYAVCRISDETVDRYSTSISEDLEKIRKTIEAVYTDAELNNSIFLALRQTVRKYNISADYFHMLLEGMRMDINKVRYRDFTELYDYSYKVAGIVGLIMLKIFGHNDEDAQMYAIDLGIAMQLTNIIRDIDEDLGRGRIYLPQEELSRYGVTDNDLAKKELSPGLRELLKMHVKRTREYYARAALGIRMIKKPSCRYAAALIKEVYEAILNEIELNDYDIFSKKAGVSGIKKLILAARALLKKEYR